MPEPSKAEQIAGRVEQWVRPEIRAISAYHIPDPAGLIKLDAMENPYTWPQELREQWSECIRGVDVNRYPDPRASLLSESLADYLQVPDGMRLLLGNGSDELIQMVLMTLAAPSRVALSVEPGFVMYRMIATLVGMRYVGVPLRDEDFALDLPLLLEAIAEHRPAVVFLAYPNNPTGNLFAASEIRQVIQAAPGLVVVDEAYAPFTEASFLSELGYFPNLLVMRTLSKMGLAGLRLGILLGPAEWLQQIDKTRLPYNINVLTQASATFALRHREVFDAQTRAIREDRSRLAQELRQLGAVQVYPSEANFVLCRMPERRGPQIHTRLRDDGVLVKNLDGAHPSLQDCLRITVGRRDENKALLQALRNAL